MAELVDALDSKSSSARSAGSIPARGTTRQPPDNVVCSTDAEPGAASPDGLHVLGHVRPYSAHGLLAREQTELARDAGQLIACDLAQGAFGLARRPYSPHIGVGRRTNVGYRLSLFGQSHLFSPFRCRYGIAGWYVSKPDWAIRLPKSGISAPTQQQIMLAARQLRLVQLLISPTETGMTSLTSKVKR